MNINNEDLILRNLCGITRKIINSKTWLLNVQVRRSNTEHKDEILKNKVFAEGKLMDIGGSRYNIEEERLNIQKKD